MAASEGFRVTAPDGVELAGAARGEGPGLLLVYGAMMEQAGWSRLVSQLADRRVYTYDRRGRGESRDAAEYAVRLEVDDLLAVAAALPRPLDLFAHSSGALLALHALMRGLPARRVVLYEPLLAALREPMLDPRTPARILERVAWGDRDGALEVFMRESLSLPDAEIERIRGGQRWQEQTRYVETAAYDFEITRSFVLEPERLAAIGAPVLLLAGGDSPAWMRAGVEAFAGALPSSRLEVMEGQGHNAQFTAPEVLAARLEAFLGGESTV